MPTVIQLTVTAEAEVTKAEDLQPPTEQDTEEEG